MGKKGDAIDGVLLLDKPEGMSSNWVLQLSRPLDQCAESRPYRYP